MADHIKNKRNSGEARKRRKNKKRGEKTKGKKDIQNRASEHLG
jgi:hypothetical protein